MKAASKTRSQSDPEVARIRRQPGPRALAHEPNSLQLSLFATSLGWIGLLGCNRQLVSVFTGYRNPTAIRNRAMSTSTLLDESDWNVQVRQQLEAYAAGEIVDFSAVELKLPETTPFRQQVIAATRRLRYGETCSYGELARRSGYPGAARAVGTVMSTNRFPILIPCHRVLAAGGKLGGYTSPAGTCLKQDLLDLESQGIQSLH